jgi:hypothetical protein
MNERRQTVMKNVVYKREYGEPYQKTGTNGKVYTERKAEWIKCGIAFLRDDGTYRIKMYAFPVNVPNPDGDGGVWFDMMDPKPRDGEEQRGGRQGGREPERSYKRQPGGQQGGFEAPNFGGGPGPSDDDHF